MENDQERLRISNIAELTGEILSQPILSHKSYGEAFYQMELGIQRKSGFLDRIQIMVSERLFLDATAVAGDTIRLVGQIRTYNENDSGNGKNHLNILIFAREFSTMPSNAYHENSIYMEGFLCKNPIRRTSPLGREICDLMLAVNRMYNKSDYIPCIAWGRNATYAGTLEVGTPLAISGRIQSREYKKRTEDGGFELKTAYEVSVLKLEE